MIRANGGGIHTADTAAEHLHPDGWMDVNIGTDSAQVRIRTARKLLDYRRLAASQHLSAGRLRALRQILIFLRPHGRVVLVRLPVSDAMLELEDQLWPDLNDRLTALGAERGAEFLDLMPERGRCSFTDGNHLDTLSARWISERTAKYLTR